MTKQIFSSSQDSIEVEFLDRQPLCTTIETLMQLPSPHIILWYIGCYGLKKTGTDFYKDFIISPLKMSNPNTTFWLVDLTAWNAFKQKSQSLFKHHSCCELIEIFSDDAIKCIRSSRIFEKMCEIKCATTINYLKGSLSRDFLMRGSQEFPPSNLRIGEVFPADSWIASEFSDWDTAKTYSIFQYLEACLIIDEIVLRISILPISEPLELVFFLPNDELKYYQDIDHSFQKDIQFLMSKRTFESQIKIKFISFPYGLQEKHRPYNSPGKVLKKNNLFYKDVVGAYQK